MSRAVEARMEQYRVAYSLASTEDPPDDLVDALRAEPVLADPDTKPLLPPFRVSLRLSSQAGAQSKSPNEGRHG